MTPNQAPPVTPPSAQSGASPDPDDQQGSAPLLVIEVTVAQDGSISVEQEGGQQEAQEDSQGGDGSDSGSQSVPVKNSAEAASLVKQMLDSATQTGPQQKAQAMNEQVAGYAGA